MAIVDGNKLKPRFQGPHECCWLTAMEMMMEHHFGTIYGVDEQGNQRTAHTAEAQADFKANAGGYVTDHADDYRLRVNTTLRANTNIEDWRRALRQGPVLAEMTTGSKRSWVRGGHNLVIAGISGSGKIAYYNPNLFGFLPHPIDRIDYMELEALVKQSVRDTAGPFWQVV